MESFESTAQGLKTIEPEMDILWEPFEELDLKYKKQNKQDYEQLSKLVIQILAYPCIDKAQIHMQANRLGSKDLQSQIKQRKNLQIQNTDFKQTLEYCQCCGYVKQTDTIKLFSPLTEISNIGVSTYLYFQTIKNLIAMLIILTLFYSLYALITNIEASQSYIVKSQAETDSTVTWVSLSLGSKQVNPTENNQRTMRIQAFLGVVVTIIWTIMLFILKYYEKSDEVKVDEETISASDFSVVIEGIPKDITKEELQNHLNNYQKTLDYPNKRPLKIQKICIGTPFYLSQQTLKDQQIENLNKEHEKMIQTFISWVKERQDNFEFQTSKIERDRIYQNYYDILQKESIKYEELVDKIINKIKEESSEATTTIFVTLQSSIAMKIFTIFNDSSWLSKIRYYLTFGQGSNRFQFYRENTQFPLNIQRAPEPEDIVWKNLGVPFSQIIKRKIITFTVTILALGISFLLVFGLSRFQMAQKNQILSLVICVVISSLNVIILQVIRRLSIYQMDYTSTNHQTSLAIKAILAQLINSIMIPMIVDRYIKQQIYTENGLASDVFMLGLTNSFTAPLLKIFDPIYLLNRLFKWKMQFSAFQRLASNQQQLNQTFQYMIFQPGYEYVYLVNLFLFTCFFVSLQPIISIFAIIGMAMMFWAQKHSLFNRMKRPVPGTDLINIGMNQIILLGGIFYSLGSLTWSNFLPEGTPKEALYPNLGALGVSLVMALLPYRAIFALIIEDDNACLYFNQNRIFLSSEYDRLNPVTSREAFEEYMEFVKGEEVKLKDFNEEEQNKILQILGMRGGNRRSSKKLQSGKFDFNLFKYPQQFAHFSNLPPSNNHLPSMKRLNKPLQIFAPLAPSLLMNPHQRSYNQHFVDVKPFQAQNKSKKFGLPPLQNAIFPKPLVQNNYEQEFAYGLVQGNEISL